MNQECNKNGHPKGLYLLFFVEMWERFSYYGMRALLILYMIQHLSFSIQKSNTIYGLYTGLVYLTPLIGGYIADKYLGQRKCIGIGALLMIIGLMGLAIDLEVLFLPALFIMIIANGFFKSNISTVVGMLYENNKEKKDSGFTIFYMGINLGSFFSPLVCGTIAHFYGFNYGFMAAGIGILIGYLIYKLFEKKLLQNHGQKPQCNKNVVIEETTTQLTIEEKRRIYVLFILMIFSIFFWVCFEQAGSSFTLFAEYSTNRTIGNFIIPTGYFQSLNPLFIIVLAPLISILWTKQAQNNKGPNTVTKFTLALILISLSTMIMALASYFAKDNLVSPLWLVFTYLVATIAELYISPIGLSLVSKLAPIKFASLLMGTWFLSSFFGNLIAGLFAGFYDKLHHTLFFMLLTFISFIIAVILYFMSPTLKRWMKDCV